MSAFGSVGRMLWGDSPDEIQQKRLNNEFRDVGAPNQFISGNITGNMGRLGALERQIAGRQMSDFRGGQQGLVSQLQAQAAGRGPGQDIARLQAQQQADRGIQQQLAMQAGQRGAGATLGARGAASNAANITGQAGQQAMMGGLQAQLMAQSQLGNALAQGRQGDQAFTGLQQQGRLEAERQQGLMAQLEQQGMLAREAARTARFGAIAGVQPAPTQGQMMIGAISGAAQAAATGGK